MPKLRSELKKVLQDRDMTQSQLSSETGLNPSTVGKMCRQYPNRFDANTIIRICTYLKLKIEDIFKIEE